MVRRTVRSGQAGPGSRRLLVAGVVCVLAAGLAAVLFWWRPGEKPEPPRARQYQDFAACLLTEQGGIREPAAAQVWAGMQDASVMTRIQVQYLAVPGTPTPEAARPYAASLAQGRCRLVLAVGTAPTVAIEATASTFPDVRFVAIGGQVGERANLSNLEQGGDVRRRVAELLKAASPAA